MYTVVPGAKLSLYRRNQLKGTNSSDRGYISTSRSKLAQERINIYLPWFDQKNCNWSFDVDAADFGVCCERRMKSANDARFGNATDALMSGGSLESKSLIQVAILSSRLERRTKSKHDCYDLKRQLHSQFCKYGQIASDIIPTRWDMVTT